MIYKVDTFINSVQESQNLNVYLYFIHFMNTYCMITTFPVL